MTDDPNFSHEVAVLNARALSNPDDRRGYRHTAALAEAVSLEIRRELEAARRKLTDLRDVVVQYDPRADPVGEVDAILARIDRVCLAMVKK